jgi:hypothetical protein
VFHCSVGKDRTGVLSALVLGFLGVPDDVIVEDYALSYEAMLLILAHLKERYPEASEIVERYRPVILSAEPASMAGFVAGVRTPTDPSSLWPTPSASRPSRTPPGRVPGDDLSDPISG